MLVVAIVVIAIFCFRFDALFCDFRCPKGLRLSPCKPVNCPKSCLDLSAPVQCLDSYKRSEIPSGLIKF